MGLYLKINPRADTDMLAMQYHKRAAIYRQRYDQTEPLDTTDTAKHRRSGRYRTAAFSRDWKNVDATKQAAKRPNEPFVCRRHGAIFVCSTGIVGHSFDAGGRNVKTDLPGVECV